MYYLSEDPWPLAGFLGLVGLGFLVPLWLTQQGKYLIRALVAFGLALLVIGIERVWVTDNERIEAVVSELASGVANRDADRALGSTPARQRQARIPAARQYGHRPHAGSRGRALAVLQRLGRDTGAGSRHDEGSRTRTL